MGTQRTVYGNQYLKVRRLRQAKEGKTYWSRQWYGIYKHRRRKFRFALGTNAEKALAAWRKIKAKIDDPNIPFQMVLEKYQPKRKTVPQNDKSKSVARTTSKKSRRGAIDATLGDYLDFVWSEAAALEPKENTLRHYENSFMRLVAIARAAKSGALNPMAVLNKEEKMLLRDLPLTILDRNLVKYFKEGVVESADEAGTTMVSAMRTANTYLRESKALFSVEIREICEDEGFILPDLRSFIDARFFKKVKVRYMLPDHRIILKTFKTLGNPAKVPSKEIYTAILLALFSGVRKREAGHLGVNCPNRSHKVSGIDVIDETKNGKPRFVPMEKAVFEWVCELADSNERYLIEGAKTFRTMDIFNETNKWLRSLGWKVNKPYHELRKLYGSMIAVTQSMEKAKQYLDHESIRTTEEYYASLEMGEVISGLWPSFKPVPHAAFAETPKLRGDSKGDSKA